jgi:hypothetical protein
MLHSTSSKSSSRFLKIRKSGALQGLQSALLFIGTVAATLSAASVSSQASMFTFATILSPANEVPPAASSGTGAATVTINDVTNMLTVNVAFSGLTTGTTASHIHCCVPPGQNAIVATTLPFFPGFPIGVTQGAYSMTFDMLMSSSYNPAFIAANGGTVASAEAALFAGMEAGDAYLNIHTTMFPGGEIRGLLPAVPLPATLPLFATGLGALGLLGWRRKKAAALNA